ncbi:GFA family protein [Amaricoccus sp. W119]|uniref:GFA family protein n=1 Tax=Amaricoccus sp. W119 TaxID=3391833 RepID=UPI0039A70FA1
MAIGGCLCGAVRYRVDGLLADLAACHCTHLCRRASGHPLAAAPARPVDLTVEGAVAWYESTPGEIRRGFCPTRASQLLWDRIGAETIDGEAGLRLREHIFVADKGDYCDIADALPQRPGGRN